MRFIEIPALITEDIEDPSIVEITEPITVSISGTTLTIDGGSKVSGEATVTLTGDTTVDTFTLQNIKQPSLHKISVKTGRKGNFTYVPNNTVTASSVSTTTKTGSDFEILLITTTGGETYVDFDMADYTSPAVYTSNALTGFDISELTSTYGATAKLYKPDGTLLTTVNSVTTGKGVNFGYTESIPGEVTYTLEVEDDLGRKSKYDLPRKWISYAMETNSTPGFEKLALAGNEYTSTTIVPNISPSSKVRVHKKNNHGYLGINFKIQGWNSTNGGWVDIDDTGENENDDESKEFLAFGDYLYHRVWVKPTAKATATVSSSNVVTLSLTDFTEENLDKSFENFDPFDIDEISNTYVFEETSKVGTIPFTLAIGGETYSNAFTVTTEEFSIPTEPNTDFTAAGPNMKHLIGGTFSSGYMCQASADGRYIAHNPSNNSVVQVLKGDGESGYTNYTTFTYSQSSSGSLVGSMSYDGKYIIVAHAASNEYTYEIWKNDESTSTFTKLAQSVSRIGSHNSTYKPSFVPRSGNYDFAITGTDNNNNFDIQLYKHTAGTDTWTGQTTINDPTNRPTGDVYRGFFSCQFTRDGKYLMMGAYSTYGGYQMYTIDWDANTAVFSGANWVQNNNIGHSGTVTLDGKYVLIFHNNSDDRKIFKNNDAGDWSSATDVTSTFTFNNGDNDQGHDISFFGEHSEYFVSKMNGGYVRVYQWLDVTKKSILLTYNDKDRITITKTGGLTTTSVKLYKDDILYHTFGASETSVVLGETGVYQAIADEKYYSLKVTVTTITETLARLYLNRFACFLIKKDGKVWYWGESNYGTNAMGNNTQVALPTLNDNLNALPSGIKQIGHCGTDAHASCAITNDGKLYTWGYNGHGQLGRGNTSDYTSQAPLLVATQSSNTFTFCHSSYYNNYAIQDNGYVWVSGHGGHYINGLGNNSNITTFTRINLPNVIDFHANHNLAVAVTSSNEVYIWGTEANSCMAGIGTTGTPTRLTALDGKNIVKVRTGGYSGHAISSDGKLYSWGKGQYHAIPDGTNSNVGTPTEMTWFSRKNIRLVDAQFPYDEAAACLALDDQGNMYVWGMSDHGAIGVYHHHPTTHSWPVLLKTNIASISVGRHSCGCIDKFGQVYTWGDGLAGQQNWIHGSNSDTDINYPTSNNLSVGSSVVYDGFDKYILSKDSTVTSNVTFGSNTVSLGTKSEVFISDPHTYKFKIMESNKTTYTSSVISSTPTRPTGRVYPPKSGTHKSLTTSGTANVDNTWTIDGALYGNGAYKASMDKNTNSSEHIYHAFSGVTGYGHMHTNNLGSTAAAAIQLHMPQKIKLTKYAMYSRNFTGEYNYAPRDWKVYGSNDNGTNWTELDSRTNETVSSWGSQTDHRDTKREYTVSGNTKYFSSYKLDVTANGGGNFVVISQIEYYGDEEGFVSDDGFGKLSVDVKGDTSATSNIVFHSNTYVMGAARDLYITDTGEYTADIYGSNKHFLGSKTHTVSGVDTVPGFTAAFHHGAFSASDYSSAYSTVGEAATAGFVYSDTPAGDYTWGTLAHVKERENPDFTANSTLNSDYSSTYGWSSNSGWEVSSKDEFSSSYEVWNAFNKRTYANNNWLSGSAPSTSSPQWLKIKYLSQQVIKSYVIRARENASPRWPTAWKLQGANTDIGDTDTGWTDIGTEQTQTEWGQGRSKSFDLSTNTTAYQYYRLRITGAKESASSDNSDYVAIGQWILNTVNDENTTNHDQYTRYSWTPASTITADVLRIAGGGGGGSHHGGGGGGGGVVYNTNQILSGQKSIVIGNGGEGGYGTGTTEHRYGLNGKNTYFSGLNAAIGGGGGSGQGNITSGGSGGSGGGSFASTVGGSPTTGQGYKGGDNVGDDGAAGGGGAGGAGSNNNGRSGGNGGLGINYTSTFGTTYGDSGWFSSGGGGGSSTNGGAGSASQGGGTNGSNTSSFITDADSHTGGGGGGSGWNGNNTAQLGGNGGSGIVLIKKLGATNPPALNFDGYNKLTIDNVDLRGYVESPTDNDKLPRASAAEREIAAGNWTPHYDYIYEAQSSPTGFYRFKICSQSASTPVNPTSDTSNTHTNNRHSILYEISTGKWYDGSPNADPNYITTTSTYAAESVTTAKPAQIWTWNGTTLNDSYVLSSLSWSQPPPDGSSTFTIKKDGAAFATTTSNTVYIRDTGTYTAEVKGLGAYVTELSKEVTGQISVPPDVNKALYTIFKLGPTSGIQVNDGWARGVNYIGVDGVNILTNSSYQTGYLYTWNQRNNTSFVQSTGIGMSALQNNEWVYAAISSEWLNGNRVSQWGTGTSSGSEVDRNREADSAVLYVDQINFLEESELSNWVPADGTWTQILSWTPQSSGNGPFSVSNHTFGLSIAESYNFLSFDNYNKITLNQLNYEDTATVTDPNESTYNLGTAKTMYVKDAGEYVFKISGTDKYVESNVYVSSVDLAGAPTKPIDFDGYNKLTLIDSGSNVSANVTYFSNTYELGSANVFYINGAGTYGLEMSGSNVFALSSNVVGSVDLTQSAPTYFDTSEFDVVISARKGFDEMKDINERGTTYGTTYTRTGNYWLINSSSSNLPGSDMYAAQGDASGMECIWVYIPTTSSFVTSAYIGSSVTNYGNTNFKFDGEDGGKVILKCGGINGSDPISDTTLRIPKGEWVFIGVYHNRDSSNRKSQHVMMTSDGITQYGSEFTGITPRIGVVNYRFIINADDAISSTNQYRLGMHSIKGNLTNPGFDSLKTIVLNQYTRTKGNFYSTLPSLTFDNYNKLSIENFTTTDKEWPPPSFTSPTFSTSTVTGVTTTNNGRDQTWTISGASYGNGEYSASYNNTVLNNANYHGPVRCFDKVNDGYAFHSSSIQTGIVTINMPEKILLDSYELRHRPNANTSENHAPRDWKLEASNDGTTWVVLDTQANQSYSPDVQGDEASKRTYTVSDNVTEYSRYRLNITANDGGTHLVIGQWKLFVKNPRTAKLTDPNGDTYTLGQTQNDIYIKDQGDYILEVTNSDQSAVVTKSVGTINPNETFAVNRVYIRRMYMLSPTTTDGGRNFKSITLYNGDTPYLWSSIGSSTYGGWEMYGQSDPDSYNPSFALKAFDDDITTEFTWSHDRYSHTSSGNVDGAPAVDFSNEYAYRETNSSVACTKIRFDAGINGGGFVLVLNQSRVIYIYSETAGNTRQGVLGVDHFVIPTNQTPFYIDLVKERPSLEFDTYNKLSIENLTPISTTLKYGSNTFDIGTASNVYIEDAGTYKVATGDATTFALVSKEVTGTPSQHPTDVVPSLTYDTSNKLSIENLTPTSTTLTDPNGSSFDIGTVTDVYIRDSGKYSIVSKDANTFVFTSNTVTGTPTGGVPGPLNVVVAFHQGAFSAGGDPYNHGSVTAAAIAGYVYSDTPTGTYTWGTLTSATDTAVTGAPQNLNFVAAYTTYTWVPPNVLVGCRTLCVAGGGGGGGDTGGGGGGGGFLESTNQTISGTQTIIVGGGGDGIRRNYNDSCYHGGNGGNSSISGTSQIAIGGGGGGSRHDTNDSNHEARAGGSGGGASGRAGSVGGAGTAGQGYAGASSTTSHYCCGGGGASEAGKWGSNSTTQADGGDGKSSDILGTTYWWSGGGGGAEHSNPKGSGGKGGGGVGAWGAGTSTIGGSPDTNGVSPAEYTPGTDGNWHQRGGNAGKHTGGGGGGGSHHSAGGGGHGGSGMVAIKFSNGTVDPPSQVYDTTKTITVSNVPSHLSNVVGNIYKGATAYPIHATTSSSNVIIKNTGTYVSVFTTAAQAFFTNKIEVTTQPTTTSEDNTIEDEAEETTVPVSVTLAFHDGTFADSDDPHSDGSITAAATAGHVYSDTAPGTYTWGTLTSCVKTAMLNNLHSDYDNAYNNGSPPTSGYTTYKWTPPGTITGARTLVVAGGGGGGADMGGGGGAGGLLASTTTNIAHTEQTIQVGDGGARGYDPNNGNRHAGGNGADSSISGPGITAIGGGGGASGHNYNDRPAGNGGSGGGGSGGRASDGNHGGERGTGTPGQGHDGARSGNHWYQGGGGGAGEKGYGRDGSGGTNTQPHGGNGLEDDILGTSYWWAGGGGANNHNGVDAGNGGKGGGGGGAPPHSGHGRAKGKGDKNGITYGQDGSDPTANWNTHRGGNGGKHTGGGGGGGDFDQGSPTTMRGGRGGSGIVAIKFTAQAITVGIAGSTAVPDVTTTDALSADTPSAVLDVAAITTEDHILDLDFTTTLPRNLKRYNGLTNSSIGARFNRHESKKKRIEKSINTDTFSIELTANNASSPTTLTVTVANSKFVINGDETPTLGFIRGETYTFDQSDASNSGHPLVLATSEDGATQYTTGWVNSVFTVPYDVPDTIYYKCNVHPNMGGEINTTFGNVFSLGDFTVAANTHVSGEYTLATNYDGTTSNLYVNGDLITQTTPTISAGVKEFILGKEFDGYVKNFKFWNRILVPKGIPYLSQIGSMSSGSWYDEGTTHLAPNIIDSVAQTSGEDWTDSNGVTHTIWGFDLKAGLTGAQQPHADGNSWITFKPGTTALNGTWYWGLPSGTAQSRSGTTISIYEGSSLRGRFTDTNMFVDGMIPITPNPKSMNNDI